MRFEVSSGSVNLVSKDCQSRGMQSNLVVSLCIMEVKRTRSSMIVNSKERPVEWASS